MFPRSPSAGETIWPLISYSVVGGSPTMSLGGPAGLSRISIQFDAWSTDAAQAMMAQKKLAKALIGYRGKIGEADIQGIFRKRSQTSYFPASDGSDEGYHRALGEYEFFYEDQ